MVSPIANGISTAGHLHLKLEEYPEEGAGRLQEPEDQESAER